MVANITDELASSTFKAEVLFCSHHIHPEDGGLVSHQNVETHLADHMTS
jgi:hypothetical protein